MIVFRHHFQKRMKVFAYPVAILSMLVLLFTELVCPSSEVSRFLKMPSSLFFARVMSNIVSVEIYSEFLSAIDQLAAMPTKQS